MSLSSTVDGHVPSFDIDLFTEEARLDPHPTWRVLREAGPVVWLERYGVYALTRYAECIEALMNWKVFASGKGNGMNPGWNDNVRSVLTMDPPDHDRVRRVEFRPLKPKAVEVLEAELADVAINTVLALLKRDVFEAVGELASVLPLAVVADLIGLPADGQKRLLEWASAGFNAAGGPEGHALTQSGLVSMQEAASYMQGVLERLAKGSWGDLAREAEARGELLPGESLMALQDYLYPSLDTTILAISFGLKAFSDHPDQWSRLRNDRSLMRNAVNEIVRLSTPVQSFTRYVTQDHEIGGTTLPSGSRVMILYASANRDEGHFENAEEFDIARENAGAQIGWGQGKHVCIGMHLARLEMHTIFESLAQHVQRIETFGGSCAPVNATLWGYLRLETRLHAAAHSAD